MIESAQSKGLSHCSTHDIRCHAYYMTRPCVLPVYVYIQNNTVDMSGNEYLISLLNDQSLSNENNTDLPQSIDDLNRGIPIDSLESRPDKSQSTSLGQNSHSDDSFHSANGFPPDFAASSYRSSAGNDRRRSSGFWGSWFEKLNS